MFDLSMFSGQNSQNPATNLVPISPQEKRPFRDGDYVGGLKNLLKTII